jgi:outer membrane protein assembly factor BamB
MNMTPDHNVKTRRVSEGPNTKNWLADATGCDCSRGIAIGTETSLNRFLRWCPGVIFRCAGIVVAVSCWSSILHAQELPIRADDQRVLIDDILPNFVALQGVDLFEDSQDLLNEDSGQLAILKTDPDLESILQKAARFAKDKNWVVATKLWQAVLDRSGDAMYSDDGEIYYSLADQVERTLADLPPDALKAYRVRADADARAILAAADGRQLQQALGKVVGSFFVSSVGDDAAFQLGCLNLDRYDFVGALRLFQKLIDRYPDSDIPLDQVHLRIALCHAFLGDRKSSERALEMAEEYLVDRPTAGNVSPSQLRNALPQLTMKTVSEITDKAIRMRLTGNRRHGVMPGLPDRYTSRDLAAVWQFYVEPKKTRYVAATVNGRTLVGRRSHGDSAEDTRNDEEKDLIDSWRSRSWRPAGQVLFDHDRIYFKTVADIAAWDRNKISEISFAATEKTNPLDWVSWRSVWRNAFKMDSATQVLQIMRRQFGNYQRRRRSTPAKSPYPLSRNEVQFFGDQVYQQMSICDGFLYAIEGETFDDSMPVSRQNRNVRFQYDMAIRRVRKNRLTAYSAASGQLQWSLPHETSTNSDEVDSVDETRESEWLDSGGFMAAPIGYEGLILVPVSEGGAVVVYALDPNDAGRTVWKSFLCDEPETGAVAWSPIQLSLDGSDLFVNTGLGAVFVLDASTGKIRFARRYPRKGIIDPSIRVYNRQQARLNFDGWSSDTVIPWQNQLICFGSDTDTIFALDRSTGRAIWSCPMNPIGHRVDYLLGVRDGMLYAAGPDTIIAYDLNGEGRMVWGAEELFDGKTSKGRGMLTEDAIYIPVDNGIFKFSLSGRKGKAEVVAKVGVNLGTNAPVGNLFSDGQRIWVHGGNRLYALGPNMDQ